MQSDYWNQVAEEKVFRHPFNRKAFSAEVARPSRIVDIGCGYGRTLDELQSLGYENLLGLDTADAMIARAKREYPSIEFRHISAAESGEPSGSVDAIILFTVLTAIPSDKDQSLLIQECERILKPGGIIYISDLYLNDDTSNIERYDHYEKQFGMRGVFKLHDGGIMRHHSKTWIQNLLSDFEKIRHEPFSVQTMHGNPSKAFQFIGKKTESH